MLSEEKKRKRTDQVSSSEMGVQPKQQIMGDGAGGGDRVQYFVCDETWSMTRRCRKHTVSGYFHVLDTAKKYSFTHQHNTRQMQRGQDTSEESKQQEHQTGPTAVQRTFKNALLNRFRFLLPWNRMPPKLHRIHRTSSF